MLPLCYAASPLFRISLAREGGGNENAAAAAAAAAECQRRFRGKVEQTLKKRNDSDGERKKTEEQTSALKRMAQKNLLSVLVHTTASARKGRNVCVCVCVRERE